MKNPSWLPALFALCALSAGCGKDDKNCSKSINAVQPNTNPTGYEVLLKTSGFSQNAKVVFGTVEASSRAGAESDDIIATVPAGLSGNVEISVEEGDCIARSGGFLVSGSLPTGVQPSLPQIIVPTSVSVPLGDITNGWQNAADAAKGIFINISLVAGVNPVSIANEFDSNGDPLFQANPVTGTITTTTNVIYLEIDRTAKSGGTIEHLDGQFIPTPSALAAKTSKVYVILLVSRETGRQLVLYYPG